LTRLSSVDTQPLSFLSVEALLYLTTKFAVGARLRLA